MSEKGPMEETQKAQCLTGETQTGELAAPACSAPSLTREQREILYHTEHRAAGGFYCGGGPDMDALVAAGLMQSAGHKSFVPDEYFRITSAGRAALRAQNVEVSHGGDNER